MTTQNDIERGLAQAARLSAALEAGADRLLTVADTLHANAYFLADKVGVFVAAMNEQIEKERRKHAKPATDNQAGAVRTETAQPGTAENSANKPTPTKEEKIKFVRQFLASRGQTENIWFTDDIYAVNDNTVNFLYGVVSTGLDTIRDKYAG